MAAKDDLQQLYLPDRQTWRDWLAENHATCHGVWLVYFKKHTGQPRVPYDDAVEEALCYGWIDATVRRMDEQRYCQMFVPRRPRSQWSLHNRRRVERLIEAGLMEPAGLAAVEIARENGHWEKALDDHKERAMPPELEAALDATPQAAVEFRRLTATRQKYIKNHVAEAKRAETRVRRAEKIVAELMQGWKGGM